MSDIQGAHHVGALWNLLDVVEVDSKWLQSRTYLSYIGSGPKVVLPLLQCCNQVP